MAIRRTRARRPYTRTGNNVDTAKPHAVVRRNITEGNSFDVVVSPSMTVLYPGFTDRDVAQAWAEQYERTNFR